MEIATGEIIALVGPNGAGKTTLLKILLGFERPTRGSAIVFDLDPWRQRVASLRNVAYVPQAMALYSGLTVADHLSLARFHRRTFDIETAALRLKSLGIGLQRMARQLSGGQQAQLVLAMALATHARILLLDEPLASLDPLARRGFLKTLGEAAHAEGTTILFTSHIVSDVEEICTTVAVIGSGHVHLHAPITDAISAHAVLPAGIAMPAAEHIADFAGRSSQTCALWRLAQGRRGQGPAPAEGEAIGASPASLEDLVLGYLARDHQAGASGVGI
jgi:ABC-2 type transport system ATP-binding protein